MKSATPGTVEVQKPPGVASVNVAVPPKHTRDGPDIAPGSGFTVTFIVRKHPVANVYVTDATPAAIPVTTPVVGVTVAVEVGVHVQVPPAGLQPRPVVPPIQTT